MPVTVAATTPAESRRALRRNVTLELGVALSIGLTTAVAGGLVPTIARQGGLAPIGLAVMAAAPFLGNLLSAFAGRVGPQGIRGYAVLRVAGASLLVAVGLAPNAALIVVAVCAFQLFLSFGTPFQTRLWGSMYPGEVRGRVIGILGTARARPPLSGPLRSASSPTGWASRSPSSSRASSARPAPSAPSASGPGGPCPPAGSRRARPWRRSPPARGCAAWSWRRACTEPASSPRSRCMPSSTSTGSHLSLADVGTIAVMGAVASMVSFTVWGTLVDRLGYAVVLRIAAAFGVVSLACVAVAPSLAVMVIAAICGGLSGAAMELGIQGAISQHTPLADRAAAMAGWNSLTGLRGLIAALAASSAVQAGLVDVTTALLLCLVPATLGLLVYLDLPVAAAFDRVRRRRTHGAVDGRDARGSATA